MNFHFLVGMSDKDSFLTNVTTKVKGKSVRKFFKFNKKGNESDSSLSDMFASDSDDDERLNTIRTKSPALKSKNLLEVDEIDYSLSDIINFDYSNKGPPDTNIISRITKTPIENKPLTLISSDFGSDDSSTKTAISALKITTQKRKTKTRRDDSPLESPKMIHRSKERRKQSDEKITKIDTNIRQRSKDRQIDGPPKLKIKIESASRRKPGERTPRSARTPKSSKTPRTPKTPRSARKGSNKPQPEYATLDYTDSARLTIKTDTVIGAPKPTVSKVRKIKEKVKRKKEKKLQRSMSTKTMTLGRKSEFKSLTWKEKTYHRIFAFFLHDSSRFFVVGAYIAIIVTLFVLKYIEYTDGLKGELQEIFGPFIGLARGSASVIKFNSSLMLLTMCRTLLTKLRSTFFNYVIPFDRVVSFHKFVGITTIVAAFIHVTSHVFNFILIYHQFSRDGVLLSPMLLLWKSIPGLSGIALSLIFFLAGTASMPMIRRLHFEIFYYSHWLWFLFYIFMIPHGMTCFINNLLKQSNKCMPGGEFWMYALFGVVFYAFERLYFRLFKRSRTPFDVVSVIKRPSNVLELTMSIPEEHGGHSLAYKTSAGMYVYINCPAISKFQYHPFTLSNAPSEGVFTINMRCIGDWTTQFANECGVYFDSNMDIKVKEMPKLYIDGPFGTSSNDIFNYKVGLLVGAGIGITPFASILKELYIRKMENRATFEKVYLFWICRDAESFEWFVEVLKEIQDCDEIEPYIYLTGAVNDDVQALYLQDDGMDAVTGLETPTFYGRPHWNTIFNDLSINHPKTDIGVFCCGPKPLARELKNLSVAYTLKSTTGTVLHFNKENF